jgi:hypothetical protein
MQTFTEGGYRYLYGPPAAGTAAGWLQARQLCTSWQPAARLLWWDSPADLAGLLPSLSLPEGTAVRTDLRCSSSAGGKQCFWGDTGSAVPLEQLQGIRLAQSWEAEVGIALIRYYGSAAADWRLAAVDAAGPNVGVLCKGKLQIE